MEYGFFEPSISPWPNMIRKSLGSDIAPGFSEPPEPSAKSSGLDGSPKPAESPRVSVAYFCSGSFDLVYSLRTDH